MKRGIWAVAGIAAVVSGLAAGAVWFSTTVQDVVVRWVVGRAVRPTARLPPAEAPLRVEFCGTGSPLPDRDRAQACAAILAAGRFLLVDAGAGASERLQRMNLPLAALEGILLTHFHSDHIAGIPDIVLNTWAAGRTAPLRVFGGPGVERVVRGFTEAMALDSRYRQVHHGADLMPERGAVLEPVEVPLPAVTDRTTVLDDGRLRVEAFVVDHTPVTPAYGYRIEVAGRVVVFSGDTVPTPAVVEAARGADVLVHEATAPHLVQAAADALERVGDTRRARILRDVLSYHTTPVEAARLANEAGVTLLVLQHVVPPVRGAFQRRLFLRGVAGVRPGGTVLAEDGLVLELPARTRRITVARR